MKNRSSKMRRYALYLFLFTIPVIMSFSLRGCAILKLMLALANFSPEQGYNAVYDSYYAADDGRIIRYSGLFGGPWWVEYTAPGKPDLLDIIGTFGINSDVLMCVGNNGTILKKNSGNWQVKNSNVSVSLQKILLRSNSSIQFVVGYGGTVLRSSDEGETWSQLSFPTTDNLYDITENQSTIFVSGENYCFYKSTDDGETWLPTGPGDVPVLGPSNSYNKIYFYDDSIGYVGGPNGLILKTFDGGESWVTRIASDFEEINDLFFISPDSGAAVGPNGVVRLTTDGGDNWFEDPDLTTFLDGETIKRIFPFSKNYGLVVGENGFDIFVAKDSTYLDSLPLVTNIKYENFTVTEFQLFQNYPNPFNPGTVISFQLPVSGNVSLKVYDIMGNEIATLINEYKPVGRYEVEFTVGQDSSPDIASGIYFYKLQTENFVGTKKMILLK